jgi:predicted Fe-Mo cluster-binding NifX family protein
MSKATGCKGSERNKARARREKMKIAVSSTGKNLESSIDPRFGRCAYFVIVETDNMSFESLDNQSAALGGGAGIQSAQFVASKGATTVITGNCGPNAVRTLSAARINVILGQTGTVRDAVEKFKRGDLSAASEANVESHYGTGMGSGQGRGMGRGMGMGRQSKPMS